MRGSLRKCPIDTRDAYPIPGESTHVEKDCLDQRSATCIPAFIAKASCGYLLQVFLTAQEIEGLTSESCQEILGTSVTSIRDKLRRMAPPVGRNSRRRSASCSRARLASRRTQLSIAEHFAEGLPLGLALACRDLEAKGIAVQIRITTIEAALTPVAERLLA